MYVRYIKRTNYKYRYIRCKIQYILTLVSEAARQRGRTFSPSTKACTVKKISINYKIVWLWKPRNKY